MTALHGSLASGVRHVTAVSGWDVDASDVAVENSLSLILETTSQEREARASLLESIDGRAGVLPSAAALAGLAPRDVSMVVEGGRIVAVSAGSPQVRCGRPRVSSGSSTLGSGSPDDLAAR
jgi:hypothetical protein